MDKNYSDDLKLPATTTAHAEYLLQSLEHAARDVSLYKNSYEIEFMRFKQEAAISTLNDKSWKFVNKFTYLGSNLLN